MCQLPNTHILFHFFFPVFLSFSPHSVLPSHYLLVKPMPELGGGDKETLETLGRLLLVKVCAAVITWTRATRTQPVTVRMGQEVERSKQGSPHGPYRQGQQKKKNTVWLQNPTYLLCQTASAKISISVQNMFKDTSAYSTRYTVRLHLYNKFSLSSQSCVFCCF